MRTLDNGSKRWGRWDTSFILLVKVAAETAKSSLLISMKDDAYNIVTHFTFNGS